MAETLKMATIEVLDGIAAQVRDMLVRLRRPRPDFAFRREPTQDGGPHVEIRDGWFHLVRTERGVELERQALSDGELLFETMRSLTLAFAQQAELTGRGQLAYSRWRWMEAHIRLMRHLDPNWGDSLSAEYQRVLDAQPLRGEEVIASLSPLDLSEFGVE